MHICAMHLHALHMCSIDKGVAKVIQRRELFVAKAKPSKCPDGSQRQDQRMTLGREKQLNQRLPT